LNKNLDGEISVQKWKKIEKKQEIMMNLLAIQLYAWQLFFFFSKWHMQLVAKKKIQGKKVPGARSFPQTMQSCPKKYWCLVPRQDSHDSSFCGNPKLQWLAQISRCQKQITGDDGNGIQNEYWVYTTKWLFYCQESTLCFSSLLKRVAESRGSRAKRTVNSLALYHTHRELTRVVT
jgi:hypothetical protein